VPADVRYTISVDGTALTGTDTETLRIVGPSSSSVNLQMTTESEQATRVFRHQAIPLAAGDKAELKFGTWSSTSQSIPSSPRAAGGSRPRRSTTREPDDRRLL
jgi:hypothetical protein